MDDQNSLWQRWCQWWEPFLYTMKIMHVLRISDLLMSWFPEFHKNRFLPWINRGARHPLYRETDFTEGLRILIVLGHPQGMFPNDELPEEGDRSEITKLLQSKWNEMNSLEASCLAHLNVKRVVKHLLNSIQERRRKDARVIIHPGNVETTIDSSPILNQIQNNSDSLITIDILHNNLDESIIGPNGIVIHTLNNITIIYREVTLRPLKSVESVRRYHASQFPCQEGDDEILVQQLIQKSKHILFVYPIFWFDAPSQIKAFIERIFISGQAFALFPYHPITSCFAWLITPISSRFGFVRRSLLRYSAHGLLRDKKSTLIETRSGPHSAALGHAETSLETTLQFCGVKIQSVMCLNQLNSPYFTSAPMTNSNSYNCVQNQPLIPQWFKAWDQKLEEIARQIIKQTC